jgi:hypothetical protein
MGVMPYEHPCEEAVLELLDKFPVTNKRTELLQGHTFDLLDIYNEHGRLELELMPKKLSNWVIASQRELVPGSDMARYWDLLGLKLENLPKGGAMTTAEFIRQRIEASALQEMLEQEDLHKKQAKQKAAIRRHVPMPGLKPDSRWGKALNGLYPAGLVYVDDESRTETIWWHYLWLWRDHLAHWEWPRPAMDLRLRTFVEMQDDLIKDKLLTDEQVGFVRMAQKLARQSCMVIKRREPVL